MRSWPYIGLATFLLLCDVSGRNIPYYDLDDDFYTEIRNILTHHIEPKITPKIPHPKEVRNWGLDVPLGQVTGISVDLDGNAVILHRGRRQWTADLFNSSNHFQYQTPIEEDVVVTLSQNTGKVTKVWGKNRFFLPHGIFVDAEGNTWITDVAMHQVLKFSGDSEEPSLTLGEKFVPGSDAEHFCKPTSVAVSSSGNIFVADGYCNSRILHFSPEGELIGQFGHLARDSMLDSSLRVPHGLALNEDRNLLCAADREHGRITCINPGLKDHKHFGQLAFNILEPNHLRVFDVAFLGDELVCLAGSEAEGRAMGCTIDMNEMSFVDNWGPIQGFNNPHSISTAQNGIIYVAEIGPNRVWKFALEAPKDMY